LKSTDVGEVMMIKAIIFDLDNTLIDFMKMKEITCEAAIEAMMDAGLKLPKKKALKELYKIYYKVGLEDPNIFERFLKKVTGEVDFKKLASAIVAYRKARIGLLNSYPGTKRTLVKLKEKGLKLAIVSDAPKIKVWIRLVSMGIEDFFDVVVALEDTGRTKPSKLPFKVVLKHLKLNGEDCLMVGDRPSRDLTGARKLGMKTAFAKYGYVGKSKRVKCDYVLGEVEDLLDIY